MDNGPKASVVRRTTFPFSTRFCVNLLLFVALILSVTIFFYRHFHPLFAGSVLVGGTIGLWGVWQIAYGWVKAVTKKAVESTTERLLGNAGVTEPLAFVLFISLICHAVTSSIYIEYEPGQPDFTVEVLEHGFPFVEPLTVRSHDRSAGRPFMLQFDRPELTFRIAGNPDYNELRRVLLPWSSLRIHVPSDFSRRKLTVLRLVPSVSLMNCYLPDEGTENPGATFSLRVTIDGETRTLPDLRKRVVYLGGSREDLEWTHRGHDKQQLAAKLKRRLIDRHVPEPSHAIWLNHWTDDPEYLPTEETAADQQILIELWRDGGEADATPLYSNRLTIDREWEGRTNTMFLEVACPE